MKRSDRVPPKRRRRSKRVEKRIADARAELWRKVMDLHEQGVKPLSIYTRLCNQGVDHELSFTLESVVAFLDEMSRLTTYEQRSYTDYLPESVDDRTRLAVKVRNYARIAGLKIGGSNADVV
jgi:hypothetical protein